MSICEGKRSDTGATHKGLDTKLVPVAERQSARHVVQVGGGQPDAELLIELDQLTAGKGPRLLGLDEFPSLVKTDFHVDI